MLGLNPRRVNTDMVELQALDPEDLLWLREVIGRHAHHTGSTVATSVLSDWPRRSAQFTKVMPRDYQRVLQATRMAKAEAETSTQRSWSKSWLIRTVFWRWRRSMPPNAPSTNASVTGARSTNSRMRTSGPVRSRSRHAAVWTAESRSVTAEVRVAAGD